MAFPSRIVVSNRPAYLADALADDVRAAHARLRPIDAAFAKIRIIVPGRPVGEFLRRHLATRLGIAANLEISFLNGFLTDLAKVGLPDVRAVDRRTLQAWLLDLLHDETVMADPQLRPVHVYLHGAGSDPDAVDRRRLQLSGRLAHIFDSRALGPSGLQPDPPPPNTWQGRLWTLIFGVTGLAARAATKEEAPVRWMTLPALFMQPFVPFDDDGAALHVFGLPPSARLFPRVAARLAALGPLRVYHLDPSEGHGDSALHKWADPARAWLESVQQALPDADYESCVTPPASTTTLLAVVQRDLLGERSDSPLDPADSSLRVLGCPGIRREAESIAAEIWQRVARDNLRFDEIAVLVPPDDAAAYTTHLTAAFREAGEIPFQVMDAPLGRSSRVPEAVAALVQLPLMGFSRSTWLPVLMHPSVMARFPDADPSEWLDLVDRLGVIHGADASDHLGTYIDRDVWTWDQGLRRLALGLCLDEDGGVAEIRPARIGRDEAATFAPMALLVRSMLADARFAARSQLPLRAWADFLRAWIRAIILPVDPDDERAQVACLREINMVGDMDLARPVSFGVAQGLVSQSLQALVTTIAAQPSRGVTVGTYMPGRAQPFRMVVLAGLGAGAFPGADTDDELDPPRADHTRLPVSAQDRAMFIEAVGTAETALVLSFVARDGQTGEPLEPSTLVRELGAYLDTRWLGPGGFARLRHDPALWRYEDDNARQVLEGARAEDRARWEGVPESVRTHDLVAGTPTARTRISLAGLRSFLECPLQGSARVVFRLSDDEDSDNDADMLLTSDEPIATPSWLRAQLLRRAFARAANTSLPLDEAQLAVAFDAEAEALLQEGQLPLGIIGAAERRGFLGILHSWAGALAAIDADPEFLPTYFGGRNAGDPPGRHADGVIIVADPPDAFRGPAAIVIEGSTCPLVTFRNGHTASVVLAVSSTKRGEQKQALRGLIDHLILSATRAPQEPASGHTVLVFDPSAGDKAAPYQRDLPPLDAPTARAHLMTLLTDLFGDVHDYLLPCEAVFSHFKDPSLRIDSIVSDLRDGNEHVPFSSRYGPVPDPQSYPPLDDARARAVIATRFALLAPEPGGS